MFLKHIIPCTVLAICCGKVFSQSFVTKFVESKRIQWAGYIIDTAHFDNPNLSLLLRTRLEKDEIKVFRHFYPGLHSARLKKSSINLVTKDDLFDYVSGHAIDEAGNYIEPPPMKRTDLFSTEKFDHRTHDMIEFEQVLYIESGRLKNFISVVSPKLSIVTSQGINLGYANLFSTGVNTEKRINKRIRKKAVALGQTITRYGLKDSGIIPLKQLYGRQLLQSFWPYLASAGYEIIRLDSSIKISFKELERVDLGYDILLVPVYDAEGNITPATALESPVDASIFSAISINREWFYSQKKNILICDITSLTLYYSKKDNHTGNVAELPIIKIGIR